MNSTEPTQPDEEFVRFINFAPTVAGPRDQNIFARPVYRGNDGDDFQPHADRPGAFDHLKYKSYGVPC